MANIISKIVTPSNANGYAVRSGFMYYGTTGGTGAAYTVTIQEATSPYNTISIDAYYDGLTLAIRFHTAPTHDAPTLQVNNLSAVRIHYSNGDTPRYKITPGAVYILVYTTISGIGYFNIVHSYYASGKNVLTNTNIGTLNSVSATTNATTYLNHVEDGKVTSGGSLVIQGSGSASVSAKDGTLDIHGDIGGHVFSSTSVGTVNSATGNNSTYLNYFEGKTVTTFGSLKITGSGNTTVSASGGVLTINSTGGGGGSSDGRIVFTISSIGTENSMGDDPYIHYVENGIIKSSERIFGDGVKVSEEGSMVQIYNYTYNAVSTSPLGTANSASTTNTNTYLNHINEHNGLHSSLKITGSGNATVSYNDTNKTLTINSTGGGGTNYAGKNVFANSANSASNATTATSNSSTYLNHVENGSVTSGGSLVIIGSGNTTVSAKNGTLTITSTGGSGPSPTNSVSYQHADYGVMGAFVGLLTIDNNVYPLAVEPARVDYYCGECRDWVSRQGVVKPYMESFRITPLFHETRGVPNDGIVSVRDSGDPEDPQGYYACGFDQLLQAEENKFIAIPVFFDYAFNEYTSRYESMPYVILPASLTAEGGTKIMEFYDCEPVSANDIEDTNDCSAKAPQIDGCIVEDVFILDGYTPPEVEHERE